jgi:hypothetical protein
MVPTAALEVTVAIAIGIAIAIGAQFTRRRRAIGVYPTAGLLRFLEPSVRAGDGRGSN